MIKQMKYPGYFLIVWDFIRYAREQGIPVGPGRGSAAGSLVAYCMRITDVDPIDYDLIFERFLNPERVSLPDIDIDFCERRRGEVIDYVTREVRPRERRADHHLRHDEGEGGRPRRRPRARHAVRRRRQGRQADSAGARHDARQGARREAGAQGDGAETTRRSRSCSRRAQRLEGMTRHASVHAAGVVIAPKPITEYAPLYKGQRDEIVTQWTMKEVERVGLLKMDFLGLSTLTLIDDARRSSGPRGIELDIDNIPLDDAKTYQGVSEGRPTASSSSRASGMRDILRKAKPQRLDDLIALNALYRPGPLKGGMVDDFIARKQGKTEVKYELPELEPILSDTYGVIAYQEQVMRIANVLAGFTLGQPTCCARPWARRIPRSWRSSARRSSTARAKNGVNEKKAKKIFDLMELRRLRLQQVALDGLRVPRLSDGVPEGELPVHARLRAGRCSPLRGAARRPALRRRPVDNDFSIQVATVNGSGSQTANLVLLRSIFQMGVPVSGKNMFPSNIAGLPTWYTIRASKRRLHRAQEGSRLPRRDEPGDGEGRRADARAGAAVVYDEPLKLNALRTT
jgi:DNA polymerase-3 subunit alpha